MSELTPEILLKAIENDLCQNSWKWLSSLSSQERKKQMSDYEKAYETEKSYWDSAIRSKERLLSCPWPYSIPLDKEEDTGFTETWVRLGKGKDS